MKQYPEALLFEGADADGGARSLIEEQMSRCQCFGPVCNLNRHSVLVKLGKGFEYYRDLSLKETVHETFFHNKLSDAENWDYYSNQVKKLERDLRELNETMAVVRKRIMNARVEIKRYRSDLERSSRRETQSRSSLAILACQRYSDTFERRSLLEDKLGSVTLEILSLEKELVLMVKERNAAKQLQMALLKTMFGGIRRHVCQATCRDIELL